MSARILLPIRWRIILPFALLGACSNYTMADGPRECCARANADGRTCCHEMLECGTAQCEEMAACCAELPAAESRNQPMNAVHSPDRSPLSARVAPHAMNP